MKRREFMAGAAAMGVSAGLSGLARAGGSYDLVLSNANALVGGSFVRRDIGIRGERIAAVAEPNTLWGADAIVCDHIYASPGWVDLHVHMVDWRHGKTAGSSVKRLGADMGVTALLDAGTTGAENFHRFKAAQEDGRGFPCYALINIKKEGIKISDFYTTRPGYDDIPAMERVLSGDAGKVVGIKYRADKQVSPRNDRLYYVRKARQAGDALNLPVMIHIGGPPPELSGILPLLKEGDIITHFLRGQGHSIIGPDGKVREEVREAKRRGVRFDVGHGMGSFAFIDAERALDQGFTDFTISSDLYILSTRLYAKTFANVLTQFLAVGMSLPDIMERASTRPAPLLGLSRKIQVGEEASITLFRVAEGDFTCKDVTGDTRKSDKRIIPEWTLIKGELQAAGRRDRRMFL